MNSVADFTLIIGLTGRPFGVATRAGSPLRGLRSHLNRARANPGWLTYSSSSIATIPVATADPGKNALARHPATGAPRR
mgnify:CR=1 FL=1